MCRDTYANEGVWLLICIGATSPPAGRSTISLRHGVKLKVIESWELIRFDLFEFRLRAPFWEEEDAAGMIEGKNSAF